jgi:O-antigen/teichoic acid export membrane protein
VQWLAALGRYSTLLLIACVALALKLTMNFLLVPIFGLQGLMIATAAMYALSFAWQYYTARKS